MENKTPLSIISNLDIMDAIYELAVGKIPEFRQINFNLLPKDHLRPSLLIEHISTGEMNDNKKLVQKTEYFTLTVFHEINDYSHTDALKLMALQNEVIALFRPGYLPVKSRSIKVKASSGGRNWDEAYVDVQFEFLDWRTIKTEELPLMEEIHTNMQPKLE